MFAVEFIDYLRKLHVPDYIGVEDFADKLSFLYSLVVLMLCTLVVTVRQYLLSAISCYIPTVPSGSDFEKFLENFCWVHGTIPLLTNETMPQTLDEWEQADKKYRINYYQWVPFMLGIQCLLFYLPRVIWQVVCSNRAGTDLEHLVMVAHQASNASPIDHAKLITHVTASLKGMLYQHREYRNGKLVEARARLFDACGLLIVSKRLGTWLSFTYFLIKLLYLINSLGQLFLMQKFLGFKGSGSNFGVRLATHIINGQNWDETRIFPRISFCYIADLRHLGSTNRYVAQCVLPINMLNEKLYIFLWNWTVMVATFTALSIPLWLSRLALIKNRAHFIKKYLRINEQFQNSDKTLLRQFTHDFLRHDGVFILRMISMNAGDVITSEIISELWRNYVIQHVEAMSSSRMSHASVHSVQQGSAQSTKLKQHKEFV